MKNLIFQKDLVYDKATKSLHHKDIDYVCSDYVGVSTICKFGELPLLEKLKNKYGKEKAERIWANSVKRGNEIHKKLELNPVREPRLGDIVGTEIHLQGMFCGIKIVGTLDVLYNNNGIFTLVEHKSKSGFFNWVQHKNKNLSSYFMQLYAYGSMLEQTYGIVIDYSELFVFFKNDGEKKSYLMSELDLKSSRRAFLNKVNLYKKSIKTPLYNL